MGTSNKKILQALLQSLDANELVKLLQIIELMSSTGKLTSQRVSRMIGGLRKMKQWSLEYAKAFSVSAPKTQQKNVESFLKKTFGDTNLELKEDETAIQIDWEGYHYKRSLDQDIDALLNS